MTDSTPWIVVRYGPNVPAHVWRLSCKRCGDMHDTPLPIDVPALLTISATFTKRHKKCLPIPPAAEDRDREDAGG